MAYAFIHHWVGVSGSTAPQAHDTWFITVGLSTFTNTSPGGFSVTCDGSGNMTVSSDGTNGPSTIYLYNTTYTFASGQQYGVIGQLPDITATHTNTPPSRVVTLTITGTTAHLGDAVVNTYFALHGTETVVSLTSPYAAAYAIGSYDIDAVAVSANGYEGRARLTFSIANILPTAAIAQAADGTDETGLTIRFDGTGSTDPDGSVVGWSWTFYNTDGVTVMGTASTPIASFAYPDFLTRTTKLIVTDNDSGVSAPVTVNVTPVFIPFPAMAHNPHQGALHFGWYDSTVPGIRVATNRNQTTFPTTGITLAGGVAANGRLAAFVHDDLLFILYAIPSFPGPNGIACVFSQDGGLSSAAGPFTALSLVTTNALIGAAYDPSIESLTYLANTTGPTLKRVVLRNNSRSGSSGWSTDTPATVTGIPSNIRPGRLFYDGTALLLCAKSGADLNLYQSTDEGFSFSAVATLATGYGYVDAVKDAHTSSLAVLLRDGTGNCQRLVARHNGAGAWQTDSIQAVSGIPANLGGMAMCSFNDTHMQANKLTSTIALRQSTDELFSFASL